MNVNARVCESCLQAATEEALASADEGELLCIELGGEIADHLCEEIESDGATRCRCACHQSVKQGLRAAATSGGAA